MLFLLPSPLNLLSIAEQVIEDKDLEKLPEGIKEENISLANRARKIALRELQETAGLEDFAAREIIGFYSYVVGTGNSKSSLSLELLWENLALDIRNGNFDKEEKLEKVYDLLLTIARKCLQLSNPRYISNVEGKVRRL